MRIAILAPLVEPVPPPLYGGTERVVSLLTEELVRRGHEVTLFASGDSQTAATLVPVCPRGLRLDPEVKDYAAYTLVALGQAYTHDGEFDLFHNHNDYLAFALARLAKTPTVTTTHGRLDLQEVRRIYQLYPRAAAGLHQPRPEEMAARRELGRDRPQRHRRRPLPAAPDTGRLPRLSRSDQSREATRPGHRDRP